MSLAHPLGWPRALHPRRTPCRIDESKGSRQHPCSTEHRDVVQGYRAWRESEEQAAEEHTIGYATETEDYWRDRQRPTFRLYLEGLRAT